ncbi:S-layer homology domain-containing protein [Cytobacillus spongiae]|uniref:S-layer homology domain-containing protein n=1 Tax=Cytobacillus spongiae TaxID=2901381 RepID=UPI001F397B40|nr:S-layer homology domain-containing protein [Cytobacillus spongiae]UII55649.1 S-layer homology domain-containing protein [Cytobacillus spongiae]
MGGNFSIHASAQGFKDLNPDYRFYEEINYLADKSIITGFLDGTIQTEGAVSRAQAAVMIGRALELDNTSRDTDFPDVGKGSFASGYIQSAVEAGLISGYKDGNYYPDLIVNRGEIAIFLARAFKLVAEEELSFVDVNSKMAAFSSIKKILAERITSGFPDNTFRLTQSVKRGEFSAFLARALDERFKVTVPNKEMKVQFFNVDQGDSALI